MQEVYVICKDFNTPDVLFFDRENGWNLEKVDMFNSEAEAYLTCAMQLSLKNVSLEKFVKTIS